MPLIDVVLMDQMVLQRNKVFTVGPVKGQYFNARLDKKGRLYLTKTEKPVILKTQGGTGIGAGRGNDP